MTGLPPHSVMPAPPKQPHKINTSAKLRVLRAARALRGGGLLAHNTSTLPGIAASPDSKAAIKRMCRFKQRNGPFLLLVDSTRTAMKICRRLSPELRHAVKQCWPGHTTLIFSARPGLPIACYERGMVAVRVDASDEVRRLAKACGGLIVSSSLNRKGRPLNQPSRSLRMRWQRHLHACDPTGSPSGKPSALLRLSGRHMQKLR